MITSMMGRMADAEKLSIPQLQMAIKDGTIPAYVGVPMLQDKMKQHQQAMAMQQAQQQQGQQQTPIADQVMQEAGQYRGIDKLRTNLPTEEDAQTVDDEYANGGIIAFAGDSGSLVPKTPQYSSEPKDDAESQTEKNVFDIVNPLRNRFQAAQDQAAADAAARGQPISEYNFNQSIDAALGEGISTRPPIPSVTPKRISEAEAARAEMLKAEAASPMGVAGLPAAQNVQIAPDKQGAGGAGGAGGAAGTGAGGSALPPTLSAAEKSDSPIASQAVSMLDKYVEMLEKSGKDVSRDKKEAFYMALIKGGLGAAGGTSPNALANIAAGAIPAMESYSKDIAGIRKDERARLEKLVAAGVSKEKIGLEAKKLGITEKHYDNWYKTKVAELGVMSGSREDMKRLSVAQGLFKNLTGKMIMPTDAELDTAWEQAQRMAGKSGVSPKITDVVADYFPGNAPDKRYVPK